MPSIKLAVNCRNITTWYRTHIVSGGSHTNGTEIIKPTMDPDMVEWDNGQSDRHALLYIVVVLLFYSLGITIAIIKYLKRERAEIEEEKAYEGYMTFTRDPNTFSTYYRMQQIIRNLEAIDERHKARNLENLELARDSQERMVRECLKLSVDHLAGKTVESHSKVIGPTEDMLVIGEPTSDVIIHSEVSELSYKDKCLAVPEQNVLCSDVPRREMKQKQSTIIQQHTDVQHVTWLSGTAHIIQMQHSNSGDISDMSELNDPQHLETVSKQIPAHTIQMQQSNCDDISYINDPQHLETVSKQRAAHKLQVQQSNNGDLSN